MPKEDHPSLATLPPSNDGLIKGPWAESEEEDLVREASHIVWAASVLHPRSDLCAGYCHERLASLMKKHKDWSVKEDSGRYAIADAIDAATHAVAARDILDSSMRKASAISESLPEYAEDDTF